MKYFTAWRHPVFSLYFALKSLCYRSSGRLRSGIKHLWHRGKSTCNFNYFLFFAKFLSPLEDVFIMAGMIIVRFCKPTIREIDPFFYRIPIRSLSSCSQLNCMIYPICRCYRDLKQVPLFRWRMDHPCSIDWNLKVGKQKLGSFLVFSLCFYRLLVLFSFVLVDYCNKFQSALVQKQTNPNKKTKRNKQIQDAIKLSYCRCRCWW